MKSEIWLMSGGPASSEAKHKALATDAKLELELHGWEIIQEKMAHHGDCSEFPVMELVIRQLNVVRIVRWHTFNKGWFEADGKHGNGIFRL